MPKDAIFKPGASTWNTDDPAQAHHPRELGAPTLVCEQLPCHWPLRTRTGCLSSSSSLLPLLLLECGTIASFRQIRGASNFAPGRRMCCRGLPFATWHALYSLLMGPCMIPKLHALPLQPSAGRKSALRPPWLRMQSQWWTPRVGSERRGHMRVMQTTWRPACGPQVSTLGL